MGNLRDQLKKANLLSKKDAKRLAHEERVHHKAIGGAKGQEAEQAARRAELEQMQSEQREQDREREAREQEDRAQAQERAACEELLRQHLRAPSRRGAARWYFRLEDGRVPWLEVAVAERLQLTEGMLCIARRAPGTAHDYGLLAVEHAERVAKVLPDRIAWRVR